MKAAIPILSVNIPKSIKFMIGMIGHLRGSIVLKNLIHLQVPRGKAGWGTWNLMHKSSLRIPRSAVRLNDSSHRLCMSLFKGDQNVLVLFGQRITFSQAQRYL